MSMTTLSIPNTDFICTPCAHEVNGNSRPLLRSKCRPPTACRFPLLSSGQNSWKWPVSSQRGIKDGHHPQQFQLCFIQYCCCHNYIYLLVQRYKKISITGRFFPLFSKNRSKSLFTQNKSVSLQRQNVCFDYAAECGEQALIDTTPFKSHFRVAFFSYTSPRTRRSEKGCCELKKKVG